MKKSLFLRKGGIVPLIVLLLFTAIMNAATITSNAVSGPWNFTTSWVGGVAPVAGDDVVIAAGANISLTANATCKSLTLSSTTTGGQINLAGFTLDVTNGVTIARPATGVDFNNINVNTGTMNVASISFLNAGGGTGYQFIYVSTGTLNVSGNVTGGAGSGASAFQLTGAGSLKLGGSIFTALNGSVNANSASTVEYYGAAAQNVIETTYGNLTLSGAGVKTVSNLNSLALTNGGGVLSIATGTQVNLSNANVGVSKIKLGGLGKMAGTYGTTLSGAAIANDIFFTVGTGTLVVSTENRIATTVVTNVASTYTYTGLPQGHGVAVVTPAIVTTPAAPVATFSYSGTATDMTVYAASATKPTKAGTYTVVATVAANENYLGSTDSDASNIAVKALTISSFASTSKVYDATTSASANVTGTLTGVVNSEVSSVISVSFARAVFNSAAVGTGKTVTANAVLTGTGMANYSLTQPTALTNGVITPAVVTVVNNSLTPITVVPSVYNGLLPVTGAITGGSLLGVASGDVISATYTGVFLTKGVATAKPITVTTTLVGANAANYTVVNPTNVTGDVTPKNLNVTGTIVTTKVYDSSVASLSTGGTITTGGGLVSGDTAPTLTQTGTYDTNAVGTGKTVTFAMTISGTEAGNYTLVQPANLTNGIITKKALTITASVTSKVYDGNTVAAVTGAVLTGVLPIDAVTLSGATTGVFANKNIGIAKVVTVTGATLSGVDAGNYSLPASFTLTGDITPKALTMPITPAPAVVTTKVYDGTTVASIVTSGPLVGIVGGENVVLLGTPSTGFVGTGTFATKDVGTGKMVTSNSMLTGADAGNYTLTQPTGLLGSITPASLTITALPQVKCFGTVKALGTTMFTLAPSATQNSEMVDNVVLTSAGGFDANTATPTGLYALDIVPSAATGSAGFLASNYTIAYVNGDFTVGVGSLVSAASSTPTLCVNTALTAITFNTSNATGIGTATNLPAGVTAAWLANVITVSGTPTVSGTFNYSIPLLGGCGPVMATGTIVVNPTLNASVVIAATSPVCQGTSVTFTATPTNGGTTPTYQWYNGATMISGATSATYSYTPAVANTDVITVRMTSNATPCLAGSPATSNALTIVVNPTLTASVAIAASPAGAVCAATLVTFTATPTNGGTPTYQWYNGATMIAGATSATYAYTPTVGNTDAITVRMTSTATPCLAGSPATSNSISTTVTAALATPTVTYSSGVLISSSLTGNQWYNCTGNVLIAGATGQTYSAPTAGTYKVVVTSGGCTATSTCVSSWPLAVNGFDSKAFSFYPNPVNNELNLSYSKEISSVKVVNVLGQVMSIKSVNATTARVDMSGLSSGLYLVEVKSGEESKTIKVMKN